MSWPDHRRQQQLLPRRLLLVALSATIALLSAVPAHAAVTTAGAAANAIPERREEEELPDYMVRPFDDVIFQWEVRFDPISGTENIIGQFNFSTDSWLAVGFYSSKRMNGPIAACWITANRSEVLCNDYVGEDYNPPSPRVGPDLTIPVLAGSTSNGGANFIRFASVIAAGVTRPENSSALDYSNASFVVVPPDAGFVRAIFAKGTWTDGTTRTMWKQHHVDDGVALSIDWRTGKKEKLNSALHRIVFYELAGIGVAVILVSFLERHPPRPRHPIRRRLFAILCVVLYLALLFQYIYFRYLDYRKNVIGKAHMRCFGDGAVFCLGTMALPVSKKLLFSTFFLCSHERAIKYHAFVGILLIVTACIHGAGMTYYYGVDGVTQWRTKDSQSRLPGIVTFVFVLFVVVPAFLRHFFWRTFRLLHYTYVLVFFFAVLHYPYAGVALAPGAALHLMGFISRRFVMSHLVGENLDRCAYDKESGVISVDFVRSDCVAAGCWFTICFPEISQFEQHPFSACRLLLVNEGKTTIVRFLAKVNKKNSSSWTARVAAKIEQAQARVAEAQAAKREPAPEDLAVFRSYRLQGPFGVLEVNPKTYRHILFVAGGMGITPHLLMLQQILINDTHSMGPTAEKLTVSLIWAVREPAVLEVFIHDLSALKGKLGTAHKHIQVAFHIFCTATPDEGAAQLAPNPYVGTMGIVAHQRPDFDKLLDALVEAWVPHVEVTTQKQKAAGPGAAATAGGGAAAVRAASRTAAEDEIFNYSVATYVSGPKSFQDSAAAALKTKRGKFSFHVHHESFSL